MSYAKTYATALNRTRGEKFLKILKNIRTIAVEGFYRNDLDGLLHVEYKMPDGSYLKHNFGIFKG